MPRLNFGDYCEPNNLVMGNLNNAQASTGVNLPNYCSSNYGRSRIFKVAVPTGGKVYVHQFRNFPGQLLTEFIGSNCNGQFALLRSCETSTQMVKTFEVNAANYRTLYIRVVYSGSGTYEPGSRNSDNLTFAVFNQAHNLPTMIGPNGEPIPLNCDGTATNRIIISPGTGSAPSPLAVAQATGLPIVSCDCADGTLVAVAAPAGVDINTVKPRVKELPPVVDTVSTSVDFVIRVPNLRFADQPDPANIPYVVENQCLRFNNPQVGSGEPVVVTIVDSGVDLPSFASFFSAFVGSNNPNCVPFGSFGTDLLNGDATPEDQIGHGTSVASAFLSGYQSNGGLQLIHAKFFGPQGGSLFDALCGAHTGLAAGSHLLNLSWGYNEANLSAPLANVLNRAQAQNTIVVASAGNASRNVDDMPYWPASAGSLYSNVLTVASYQGENIPGLTYWTNYGVGAVGAAAFHTTQTLRAGGGLHYPVGTSISAPIVARYLAQLRSRNFGASAADIIKRCLENTAFLIPA
ncbi:MAG: S8 family serine peptidase [Lewinella sp.]|nr:S8 family serine peptidase [Lewinella sp.]